MSMTVKHLKNYRWIVLFAYMGVLGVSQLLWLNFAPITNDIIQQYHTTELWAGMLTIIFPLIYVFLSIPSGRLIDQFGYKAVVSLSALWMVVFAFIRILDHQMIWLLIGQLGVAIAQPFIFNSISKLVSDCFDEDQVGLAMGIGTVGAFIGMIVGLGLSPWLSIQYSIHTMLWVSSLIALAAFLIFVLLARQAPTSINASQSEIKLKFNSIKTIWGQPQLRWLFILSFLAIGTFNTLMTWLQPMLAINGITDNQAGCIGALLIGCGVIGSIILPAISDRVRRRRPFLIFACLATIILFYPFVSSDHYASLLVYGGLLGFLFLPGYALLLTMTEEWSGKANVGTATGVFMLMGNAGGVIFSLCAESLNTMFQNWVLANGMMFAMLLITLLLTLFKLKDVPPIHSVAHVPSCDREAAIETIQIT